jgi:hypothetical protein
LGGDEDATATAADGDDGDDKADDRRDGGGGVCFESAAAGTDVKDENEDADDRGPWETKLPLERRE